MNTIQIFEDTKIYVVAPAKLATGGPEILHSLAHHLKTNLNIPTFMYYLPKTKDPTPQEYKTSYTIEITNYIEDKKNNIIIVPETIKFIKFLKRFKEIRKIIYWLSVDFFYQSMFYKTFQGFSMALINKINTITIKQFNKKFLPHFDIASKALSKYSNLNLSKIDLLNVNLHLTQGIRIANHLKEKGLSNVVCIFDYINKDFLEEKFSISEKENIVCYNPKKGFEFTSKIIEYCKKNNISLKFIPIIGLDRKGVISLLKRAKVYIDFSNFPGRERIPREAVMLGCCVITGKRGSAKYFEDVPIPEEYKFEDKYENIPNIIQKIQECLTNYENKLKDFELSREIIKNEPIRYINLLKSVFVK